MSDITSARVRATECLIEGPSSIVNDPSHTALDDQRTIDPMERGEKLNLINDPSALFAGLKAMFMVPPAVRASASGRGARTRSRGR
jgi:hypothetical protein